MIREAHDLLPLRLMADLWTAQDDDEVGTKTLQDRNQLGRGSHIPDVDAQTEDSRVLTQDGLCDLEDGLVDIELEETCPGPEVTEVGHQVAQSKGRVEVAGIQRGQENVRIHGHDDVERNDLGSSRSPGAIERNGDLRQPVGIWVALPSKRRRGKVPEQFPVLIVGEKPQCFITRHPAGLRNLPIILSSTGSDRLHVPEADHLVPVLDHILHDPGKPEGAGADSRFLLDLTKRRLLEVFSRIQLALRKRPLVTTVAIPSDEEQLKPSRPAAPDQSTRGAERRDLRA